MAKNETFIYQYPNLLVSGYKMKHKLSISMEEDTILRVLDKMRDGLFRNKSHLIEHAVVQFLNENQPEKEQVSQRF